MSAKTLMIQGTASNVGKSVMTAAFCRIFKNQGLRVAPFKAQNMSNNSYVTACGGEIGRAQAVQAEACGIEPTVEMNPILLKPSSDMKAQVILMGKPVHMQSAREYQDSHKERIPVVDQALRKLMAQYDLVVIEGAGSPAEMNLKDRDIVNMHIAKSVSAPVILVGDIDWGGIFAQLVGTFELFDEDEKDLVKVFLVNKFRGDKAILEPGLDWIEERTDRKVLGVIPYLSDLELAQEDSIAEDEDIQGLRNNVLLDALSGKGRDRKKIKVSREKLQVDVIWLPHISNFTDMDALKKEKDVSLRYLHEPDRHSLADLLILPGTKSTMADLKILQRSGWEHHIRRSAKAGVRIVGICGGYQMLGERILDPEHIESGEGECRGLGLLPIVTTFARTKKTVRVKGIHLDSQTPVEGYEIHMGKTRILRQSKPVFKITQRQGQEVEAYDGICQGNICGTYLHGIFDSDEFRRGFLNEIREQVGIGKYAGGEILNNQSREDVFDRWARVVEENIDMKLLETIVGTQRDRPLKGIIPGGV